MSVSAVVPTLGRSPLLVPCLEALRRDGGSGLEIVVVDQGEQPAELPAGLADRVLRPGRNLGFARGTNLGIAAAAGRLIATVNDDVLVEPGWTVALTKALEEDPRAAAAQGINLILDTPGRMDGCGIAWNRWWQAVQVGHGLVAPPRTRGVREIFGVSATAALYRREALAGPHPRPLSRLPPPDPRERGDKHPHPNSFSTREEETRCHPEGEPCEREGSGRAELSSLPDPLGRRGSPQDDIGEPLASTGPDAGLAGLPSPGDRAGGAGRGAGGEGPFDPRLISYYEDVDLAGRLRAAGWHALLVPAARALHAGSATGRTMSRERWRLIYGNRWLAAAHLLGRGFWPRLPSIVLRDFLDLGRAVATGDGARMAGIVAGWGRALGGLPAWAHGGAPAVPPGEIARFR